MWSSGDVSLSSEVIQVVSRAACGVDGSLAAISHQQYHLCVLCANLCSLKYSHICAVPPYHHWLPACASVYAVTVSTAYLQLQSSPTLSSCPYEPDVYIFNVELCTFYCYSAEQNQYLH